MQRSLKPKRWRKMTEDRASIFGQAFRKDPEFYAFYRSMQAYETALQPDNTRMILPPDSRFFRFFASPLEATPSRQAR